MLGLGRWEAQWDVSREAPRVMTVCLLRLNSNYYDYLPVYYYYYDYYYYCCY